MADQLLVEVPLVHGELEGVHVPGLDKTGRQGPTRRSSIFIYQLAVEIVADAGDVAVIVAAPGQGG